MNTKLYILGAFALGVGCGSFGAYIYVRKKFDQELEEQTKALKNWAKKEVDRQLERAESEPFLSEDKIPSDMGKDKWPEGISEEEFELRSRKIKDKTTRREKVNYASLSRIYHTEKPDLEDLANKLRAEYESPKEDDDDIGVDPELQDCYREENQGDEPVFHTCEGKAVDSEDIPDGELVIEDHCLICPFYKEEGKVIKDSNIPNNKVGVTINRPDFEIISEDEFFDPTKEYDSEQLTYYKEDDTLCDTDDDPVNIEKTVGGECLTKFEDGTVYVRNHLNKTDYEIEEMDKSYQEYVLGIEADDKQATRARFADREEE